MHKFQSLVSRPPNCYIQFKLCACGSVHGHLISLTDLDAATPLYVGDPPVDHLDFVIQFDGGAFREHRVGGAGIVLWKHTTQGLTLLDTFAVPLFPCPDAAYAETVGAAHAVLMAARHFPLHRPSRILVKGDNRPIIDFMNSVGKLRRPDLQKLLTEAQHALAFSLPPLIWSYTPREFNKCADFLAGIARDYAKQSLTPDLLPYSLSPFVFPLPPSLSPLYSPPPPLTFSPPSSAFTFQESPDFPISVFPQLARKAAQFPPLQRYLRALQKGPSSIPTISVLYRPTADDQRGRLYPLALGASKLSRHYRALLFGRSHTEIDITGGNLINVRTFLQVSLVITRNNPSLPTCCLIPFLHSFFHFPLPFLLSTRLLLLLHSLLHPPHLPFRNLRIFRSPHFLNWLVKLFRSSATSVPFKRALPPLLRSLSFIAPQQMIRKDAFTPWRLGPPNFLGITVPFCLVAPMLKLTSLAPIISSFNVSPSLSLASPFPLLINFGTYLRKIFLLLILASLNTIPLLLRTCPQSSSTPLLMPLSYITVARDIGLLSLFEPFYIRSFKQNPASLRLSIPPLYLVLPYICEPLLSYYGT